MIAPLMAPIICLSQFPGKEFMQNCNPCVPHYNLGEIDIPGLEYASHALKPYLLTGSSKHLSPTNHLKFFFQFTDQSTIYSTSNDISITHGESEIKPNSLPYDIRMEAMTVV